MEYPHCPFSFDDNLSWSANSIEPGQTAWMCRLPWLYTDGKGESFSVPAGYGQDVAICLTVLN